MVLINFSISILEKHENTRFKLSIKGNFNHFQSHIMCTMIAGCCTFIRILISSIQFKPSYCIVQLSKNKKLYYARLNCMTYNQCRKLLWNRQHPNETIQTKRRRKQHFQFSHFQMNTH